MGQAARQRPVAVRPIDVDRVGAVTRAPPTAPDEGDRPGPGPIAGPGRAS
jgi:hypothetical protein